LGVAKSAGSFLGGILNNPGALLLGGLAIGLLFFRGDIRQAFASVGESLGNIGSVQLPDISLPEIKFPEINLDFLPDIFGGGDEPDLPQVTEILEPTQPGGGGVGIGIVDEIKIIVDRFMPTPDEGEQRFFGRPAAVDGIPTDFREQSFFGGGISFEGGTVRETPIEFLSLSQIIDRFNVTASQAADIRARARDDFGDFDFGSNLGFGLGGVVGDIPELQPGGAVSDPEFEGLTAQEIFQRLVGGNISNF